MQTPGKPTVTTTALPVEHVKVTSSRPYAQVKADLEGRLGRLDDGIRALLKADDIEGLRAALRKAAGTDGLVIHYIGVHGDWLALKGERRNTTAYLIGNILSAVEMTSIDLAAGLYAPLRLVIYENGEGGTTSEYDRPSTLFGQFGQPEIDAMAGSLDGRMHKLVMSVSQAPVDALGCAIP